MILIRIITRKPHYYTGNKLIGRIIRTLFNPILHVFPLAPSLGPILAIDLGTRRNSKL